MRLKIMRVQLQGVAHIDMRHLTEGAKGQFCHRVLQFKATCLDCNGPEPGGIFFVSSLGLNLLSCSCLAK